MSVIHHSISRRNVVLLTMSSLLGLAGCTAGNLLSLRPSVEPAAVEIVSSTTPLQTKVPKSVSAALPLKPRVEPVSDIVNIDPARAFGPARQSSWCEQLRESSAADATILRSPTLSGSLSDSGKASLNLSINYASFAKAKLLEQAAEARCRKYLAETGLQVLVFVSPQNLTAAGYKAKAQSILSQTNEIKKLRKAVAKAMASGAIDKQKATAILLTADQFLAEGSAARSQSERRISERLLDGKSADALSKELLKAESDIDRINSKLSTAGAIDVSAKVGWGDDTSVGGVGFDDQSFNGKVSFSMQLGALNPNRFEHERRASEAKQRAILSEEGGAIWQIGVLRRAHERAISGLDDSRIKLDAAIAEAGRLLAVLNSEPQPEFEGARLAAKFEIMKLRANRAGLVGSIAEIKTNLDRLKNG
jgi:hypothetical protein